MKQSIVATGMALSALGAQAQAPKACSPDEIAVFSAAANAIVECKPGQKVWPAYVHAGTPTVELWSSEQSDKRHSSSNSNLLSVAATNSGAALGATVEAGDVLVRISAETQKDLKGLLLGLGVPVGDTGYLLLSGTQYREALTQYGKNISSVGINIEAWVVNPLPGVQSFVVELAHARAGDKHLQTESSQYSYTVEDVLRTIRETDSEKRTETRTTRTTTTVTETTDTHFRGGEMNTVRLGAKLPLWENTLITVGAHYSDATYSGKDTGATLGVTHYMPEHRANVSVWANSDGVVALGVQKQLSDAVTGFLTVSGKDGKYAGYAGINYAFGGKAVNPGIIPDTGLSSLRSRMESLFPGTVGIRPSSLGRVESETVVTEEVMSDTDTQVRVVKKPKPPENPPEIQNTPLNIGNIACTATVIQHGQTTTCQITPVDPDGIQSLRAEINGSSLSVSESGGTYTITIPAGLPAGGASGTFTSRSHNLMVYATGKKPDGTPESEQSTSENIEVQCQWVWINEFGWICSI